MKLHYLLILGLLPLSLFAEDKSRGCGLGTLATPNKSLVSTTTAEVIDAVSFPTRPFAITSGTSGCAKHDLVKNEAQLEHYIASNLNTLKLEAAIGSGERVVALARIYGCSESATPVFVDHLKKNYQNTIGGKYSASDVMNSINSSIVNDQNLKECLL